MSASVKGGVSLGEYVLRFDINALCEIEARFDGKAATEVFAALQASPRMTDVRAIFAIGLGVEETEAGTVIGDHGLDASMEAFGKAVQAAFPAPSGKPSRPLTAASAG